MIAAGIDLGGTKIEAQVFDTAWKLADRRRIDTPTDYRSLVAAVTDQINWITATAGAIPIGIAAAGLVNPATGLALTANLPATGQPFPQDIEAAAGRRIVYINDCRALTLSEAVFGAAQGQSPAIGLILGTGLGGGVAVDGRLIAGPAALGGEFGHFAIAAGPMIAHGLPLLACGCGRVGCTETLISGPGLSRIVAHKTGQNLTPPQIVLARETDPDIAKCWAIWCELTAEMLLTLCLAIDPACVVLGGGLSTAPGVIDDLTRALRAAQLHGFAIPALRLAQGGDASGARGAAYAAHCSETSYG
jgi:N-acetylglucosamine kinase